MSELMRYYGQFGNANGIRNDRPVAKQRRVEEMLSEVELVELKKYVRVDGRLQKWISDTTG